ncbi:MAG TPA: hypothetical protein VGS80_22475, partial [Ktedonobacterales bacterium]|nr:hypothetical protein [Ktedonobacterales bacterium]
RIGIVVFGEPLVGKTRLALEALRNEVADFPLLVWPCAGATLSPAALEYFRGHPPRHYVPHAVAPCAGRDMSL